MGKWWRIFAVLFLLMALAVVGWRVLGLHERVYQGKTAREWFRIAARTQPQMYTPSPEVAEAFNALGPDAVAVLAENLELAGSKWRDREVTLWYKLPHFLQKRVPEPIGSVVAAETARQILHALPAKMCREVGARATPTLLKRLDHMKGPERGIFLDFYVLESGPPPEMILPFLYKAMHDREANMRVIAIYSLLQYHVAKDKIPELARMLDDPDANVGNAALVTLARAGPEAKAAVPVIEKMLTNSNFMLQHGAAYALWRIDRQTNTALAVVTNVETLRYDQEAVEILSRMGEAGKVGIPDLLIVANTTNNTVIAQSSPNDPPPHRYNLFMEDVIRFACCRAVDRLDPGQDGAILPALIDMLNNPYAEPLVCKDILNLLAKMGPDAATALPSVERRLKSQDKEVRTLAEKAVKSIGGEKSGP